MVADLVIEGVGPRRSEDAVWAIGSIGVDLSAEMIKRRWAAGEVQTLVDTAVKVLNQAGAPGQRDDRSPGVEDKDFTSFQEAVSRDGIVTAFARLKEESLELVNQGLHPTVANLIDLAVELCPDQVPGLVSRLEVPIMQARAARRMVARTPHGDPGATLGWITEHATDGAIALAIVHVLGAARKLDDARTPPKGPSRAPAGTEVPGRALERPPDAVGNLVLRLLERLASLAPTDCLRWIGEILNQASRALSLPGDGQKPRLLAPARGRMHEIGGEPLLRVRVNAPALTFPDGALAWSGKALGASPDGDRPGDTGIGSGTSGRTRTGHSR